MSKNRKMIQPHDWEDRMHVIAFKPPKKVLLLDATRTDEDEFNDMVRLRLRLGIQRFDDLCKVSELKALEIEAAQKKAKEIRQKKSDEEKKARETPLNTYVRAVQLKNYSFAELEEWIKTHNLEERQQTLTEIQDLIAHRAIALDVESSNFAVNYLRATIFQTPPPDPQPKSSAINRLFGR